MLANLDKRALGRTLVWTALGGAAGGFWAFVAIHGLGLGHPYWITLGLVALGVAAAALLSGPRPWLVLLAPLVAIGATGALAALVPGQEAVGLALWGAVTVIPLALGAGVRRGIAAGVAGAILGIVALGLARTVEVGALVPLATPSLLGYPIAGAVVGFTLGLSALPRSFASSVPNGSTPVRVPGGLKGEFREAVDRAVQARGRVQRALRSRQGASEGRAAVERAVDELVRRVATLAERWRGVDDDLAGIGQELLDTRLQSLRERQEACQDDEARQQLEWARRSVEDQRRMHEDIQTARQRTLARLHALLAGLDRVHLAVVRLRSADANRFASEIQPVLDELSEAGSEADIRASAMDEAGRSAS